MCGRQARKRRWESWRPRQPRRPVRRCVRQWERWQWHARYLDPDAFGHLALARVLLDRRAERFSDLRSDLQRRRWHALRSL